MIKKFGLYLAAFMLGTWAGVVFWVGISLEMARQQKLIDQMDRPQKVRAQGFPDVRYPAGAPGRPI